MFLVHEGLSWILKWTFKKGKKVLYSSKTGQQEVQSNSFLCKKLDIVFFGKGESLISEVSTNNCKNSLSLSFSFFFPQEIFFPKSSLKGPVTKIGQSFKKVCI